MHKIMTYLVIEGMFDFESLPQDLDFFITSSTRNDFAASSMCETDDHLTDGSAT